MNANHVDQKCRNRQQKDREGVTAPFTKEREIWIVKRSALMTPTQLRWSFINQFLDPKKSHHLASRSVAFTRLIQRFDATGGVTGWLKDPETVITLENIENVKQYFTENPRCSIREGCSELDLSYTIIWRILRKYLHWKAYKSRKVINLRKKWGLPDRIWWTFLRQLWNPCKIGAYFELLYIFKIFELVVIFQKILVFKTQLAWITL